MKRIEEKVRDIVEVSSFTNVPDLAVDPAKTLAGYHFTDITADLMAKWLEAVMSVRPGQGKAVALAGYRGVGKSHFLACTGAILSQPDVRSKITDQHVAASAERLPRRHGSVAFVHRGSHATLLEEIKAAIAKLIGDEPERLNNSLNELLLKGVQVAGDKPFILLVDTAHGRELRVSRDDGIILSELAEAAKSLGIFVGLALDDDIAGADGANLSISGSYVIDYLDQEHLYKIVESNIFIKKEKARPILHDIYKNYSSRLTAFRWSEPRFTALYPLHPATLEIAPLIRLHVQDFSLLSFAAEAGVRILGRPANSLIGLDEVFDAVEARLRQVKDLKEAFVMFDELDRDVVGKTPVNQRLPAKLILKGLFMLSLDGMGSTADELAAAMLIVDEGDGRPIIDIKAILDSFVVAKPQTIIRSDGDEASIKYCFTLNSEDDLNQRVGAEAKSISIETASSVLLRQATAKYSDLSISTDLENDSSICTIEWRGAVRHGEIFWNLGDKVQDRKPNPVTDWTVTVSFGNSNVAEPAESNEYTQIHWQLGELKSDEIDALRRHYVLQTNSDIREQFKEKFTAAIHIQSLAVEKIWQRVFLIESRLIIGRAEYAISEEARGVHTLAQMFTIMLAPIFEFRFPEHPYFSQLLSVKEAAKLTGQFFGGAGRNNSDVQKLAESFGLPLGLVELQDDLYVPVNSETLVQLPAVRAAFDGAHINDEAVVKITDLASRMRSAASGLTREAQHLILTALVAQRQFDFVTFSGNRISQRSLDLQIIWDDIEGIAKPFAEVYSSERLREWAILISGNTQIKSLERSEDRLLIIDTLTGWLTNWNEAMFLETFESLPDESLNSSIWTIAANLRKTFGVLAESIDALIQNVIPLDQCLQRIADLFSDSETEYESKKKDLIALRYFTDGAAQRKEISTYLALCETTDDADIEQMRCSLLDKTGTSYFAADPSVNNEIDTLWHSFKQLYIDHYVEKHDAVMNSKTSLDNLSTVLRSDKWSAFESLSDLAWFDSHFSVGAKALIRNIHHMDCTADVRQQLETKPFCSCSFNLARFERRKDQSSRLEIFVDQGLLFFRARINENADELRKAIDSLGQAELGTTLKRRFEDGSDINYFSSLTGQEMQMLRTAIRKAALNQPETRKTKRSSLEDFSELFPNEMREWEDDIDNLELFANK